MTSTLWLIIGASFGFFLACITILLFIRAATHKGKGDTQETLRLMKERNDLDKEKVKYLNTIADWCDHNWNSLNK